MDQPPLELIRKVGLFADLDDKTLESLGREFRGRRYESGQEIATEGTGGLLFFVVESGEAKVSLRGEELGRVGPGDAFGELALVDLSARSATVTALAPMRCWVLPRGASARSCARILTLPGG